MFEAYRKQARPSPDIVIKYQDKSDKGKTNMNFMTNFIVVYRFSSF